MVEESRGESIQMVVENSPASLAPVDKPRGGAETLEDARDSRGRQGRALRF